MNQGVAAGAAAQVEEWDKEFTSPTLGSVSFDAMFTEIQRYVQSSPEDPYKLIVGADSQAKEQEVTFVTAIVLHRVGKGARYFYQRHSHRPMASLRQRIFYEASLSLTLAGRLAERLAESGYASFNIEIHLDVGPRGDTRELIREIVGMVTGSGFDAKIKPDSFGASTVADKYTK